MVREEIVKLRKDAPKYGYEVDPLENMVMTAHYYPVTGGSQRKASGGEYVENTDMESKSADFVKTMKYYFKDPEIYLTETGYDKVTNKFSKTGTPVAPGDSVDVNDISTYSQAKQVTRLVLSNYASGYDKIFLFTLKDPVHVGARGYRTKFSTTGLIRKKGAKDHAWYAVNALGQHLKNYTFESMEEVGDVRTMELRNNKSNGRAYIIWLTTNENKSIKGHPLALGDQFQKLKKVELSDIHPLGSESNLRASNGKLMVDITEFPQLIICEK
ncbi:MAG: hypothetical protein AAFN93_21425 [Bacteroidota bacterium]